MEDCEAFIHVIEPQEGLCRETAELSSKQGAVVGQGQGGRQAFGLNVCPASTTSAALSMGAGMHIYLAASLSPDQPHEC